MITVSICLCTFKRVERLVPLLERLRAQDTNGHFKYSLVVVDNDRDGSARETVEGFARRSDLPISYHIESEQNIAKARNRSVQHAAGNLVAFIDDDEMPPRHWLLRLYDTLKSTGADGVLGPVKPFFEVPPPDWTLKARLFERPAFKTGEAIHWAITGTGNVLLRRECLQEVEGPFLATFSSGGEDTDFFRRSMERGRRYVWCDEADVHEFVPPERTQLSFQLRRALMRGRVAALGPAADTRGIARSLAAALVYTALLPVGLVRGPHVFYPYLIKNCDHIGKLLALCGLNRSSEKYILK